MKRVVIFAHFDKHNIIDPYVISYLEELKKYSEIIFVSDGDLKQEEISKIDNLCFDNICFKHNEYDFGSYKRGFELLKTKYSEKFNKLDEILFVNDSCYLIGSFEKIFADMEKNQDCNFWGLSDNDCNNLKDYHIQSYFLSFRKEIFLEEYFQNFIKKIKKEELKVEIIHNYEIGLFKFLVNKNNKKCFCFFSQKKISNFIIDNNLIFQKELRDILVNNTKLSPPVTDNILKKVFDLNEINFVYSDKYYFLIKMGFPLIKREILLSSNSQEKLLFLWQEILKEVNAKAVNQIKNHCNRVGFKLKNKKYIKNKFNLFLYYLLFLKIFYIKEYFKNGKKITIIKLFFFKIKINEYKRFKLFGIRIWKK